ncbi:MAG: hypothetical protein D6718_06125 [Acidobacteria bacterium]|nr:MAG: hypothetical protein D6718_06125 [Acidobacteriota bacterium]
MAAALLAAALAAGAAPAPDRTAELRQQLTELLGDAPRAERVKRLARVVWLDPAEPELRSIAKEWLVKEAESNSAPIVLAFFDAPPAAQVEILDLFREHWSTWGRGTDPWRNEMLRVGLSSPDRSVRRAAARLLASAPFPRIAHIAVDAAMADPDLTVAALTAMALNRDAHAVRWVCRQLLSGDDRVEAAARHAIWGIGHPAASCLLPMLESDDRETRRRALEALLTIAGEDELPALHRWLELHAEEEPALADRVLDAVAQIEAGLYRPEPPPRPERLFPDD